jgi:lipid-A-disaccharide synthase-like uncharacterized protein
VEIRIVLKFLNMLKKIWTRYPMMFFYLSLIGLIKLLYFYFSIRETGGKRYANL